MTTVVWNKPPQEFDLSRGAAHIWRTSLQSGSLCQETLKRYLSPDETIRAERFHFQKDREHFIIARGKLRIILSRYLGIGPEKVSFRYNAFGKPSLASEYRECPLRFNVSHSNEVALYAMAWNRVVGIDIEYMRPISEAREISARFFSLNERRMLDALPADQRLEMFYQFWTRKEAYAKARGDGLSRPLAQFDTSLIPKTRSNLIPIHDKSQNMAHFCLMDINVGGNYAAASVIEGHSVRIEFWDVSEVDAEDDPPEKTTQSAVPGANPNGDNTCAVC
jgi:4'-phosphopantetheinyl transferase